ncbi:uncharacterized protein LOC115924655 [Strongylocentrotus purpuratus]|uniref:Uncharacterized protein n=1 Tax=Strongylocentrotus purpuratus TaxID=7668 RepID=A0A7M7SZP6_STRPU|nr:uncharacterized protein LOC115924655 [Strongylocentrotus purpuratus]
MAGIKNTNDEVHEEEEESDEAAPSGSRPKRGCICSNIFGGSCGCCLCRLDNIPDADGALELVTVHQSGDDQSINASGGSNVKSCTMTGPVTNLTIHNHPAESGIETDIDSFFNPPCIPMPFLGKALNPVPVWLMLVIPSMFGYG